MFIFDQPYQYFEEPWPHIVIENVLPKKIADHMLHNWPETNVYNESHKKEIDRSDVLLEPILNFGANSDDPIYEEFEYVNFVQRTDEILETAAKIFNDPDPYDCDLTDLVYREVKRKASDPVVLVRDWHTDKPQKKYNSILYIGSGENAGFQALNKKTGIDKMYEYRHNRLIWWRNTREAVHRFYSGNASRKTINLASDFKQPKRDF